MNTREIVRPGEQLVGDDYDLCVDAGGVLRSQVARKVLNCLGIQAVAAALGDVSNQFFQGYTPDLVLGAMRDWLTNASRAPIQEVTIEMAKYAKQILVFEPRLLCRHPYIDISDPRVHIIDVPDISDFKDPSKYNRLVRNTALATFEYAQQYHPEKYKAKGRLPYSSRSFPTRLATQ